MVVTFLVSHTNKARLKIVTQLNRHDSRELRPGRDPQRLVLVRVVVCLSMMVYFRFLLLAFFVEDVEQ